MVDAAQDLVQRMQEALRYPADDTYATTIVVLIIIASAVFAALVLIALALPHTGRSHPEDEDKTAEETGDGSDT